MSITTPESVCVARRAGIDASRPTLLMRLGAGLASPALMLRRLALNLAVWTLYVPHYSILWILGPRYGLPWARAAAYVHWLLSFVGAQRLTRRALAQFHPMLDCSLSVSTLLRKHLQMKHECFARVRVYHQHGSDDLAREIKWIINAASPADLPDVKNRDRGVLVVGYHFGFYQLLAPALSQVLPDCNAVQLRLGVNRCADDTVDSIERLICRRAVESDRRSGASILYVTANIPLFDLFCILRDCGCVAIAADGMVSDDFIEVPFFDGVLRVPNGWAKLAAITRSEVLLVCDRQIDRRRRDFWVFDQAQCEDKSDAAAHQAVAEAIRILEGMIRLQPWSWHPWQRLRWHVDSDGVRHYRLKKFRRTAPAWFPISGRSVSTDGDAATTSGPVVTGRVESPMTILAETSLPQ